MRISMTAVAGIFCLALVSGPVFAADYNAGVTAKVLSKTSTASNGEKLEYLKTASAEVTSMAIDIAPGCETGWHLHEVPVYAYVVSGTLVVDMADGKTYEFREGQVILEVMHTPHNGINRGNVPVKLIAFYAGEKDKPIVVKIPKPASATLH